MKTDEAGHFFSSPIPKVALNSVLNHLPKLFNAFPLSYNRMPEACRNKSSIDFVFTYFKNDLFHPRAI